MFIHIIRLHGWKNCTQTYVLFTLTDISLRNWIIFPVINLSFCSFPLFQYVLFFTLFVHCSLHRNSSIIKNYVFTYNHIGCTENTLRFEQRFIITIKTLLVSENSSFQFSSAKSLLRHLFVLNSIKMVVSE